MLHIKEILEQGRTIHDLKLREQVLELYLPIIKLDEGTFVNITTKKYSKKHSLAGHITILTNEPIYDITAHKQLAALFPDKEQIEEDLKDILKNKEYVIIQFKDLFAITYTVSKTADNKSINSKLSWEPLGYYSNNNILLITQNHQEAKDRLQKYKCDLISQYHDMILNTRLISI